MNVLEVHRIRFGAFEFDRLNRLLYREGTELSLPPRAVGVLCCLLDRPGQIVSKQVLLDEVWKEANVTETSLTEAVSLLRQVLIDDPQRPTFIQTVPRRGYRFVAQPALSPISPSLSPASATGAALVDEPAWPAWLPWMFVVVSLAVFGAIVVAVLRQPSTYARPVVRFVVDLPAGLALASGDGPSIALSRSGQQLAFVARRADGVSRLYVRDLDRLDAVLLDGTEGAAAPFFSPDGRWVGFFAGGALKKVPPAGGAAVALCDARVPLGAAWTTRRTILFAASLTGGLSRVHEDGGTPVPITTPDAQAGEVRHAWPDLLPDDAGVLFAGVPLAGGPETSRIAALSFDTNRVQTLVDGGVSPHYAPTGHLLFARDRAIVAAPFDPDTLELLGPAVPVLDNVAAADTLGAADFVVAPGGHAAVVRLARPETTAIYHWVRIEAASSAGARGDAPAFTAPFPSREIRGAALSPDASRLAVSLGDGHRTDIWVSDLARDVPPGTSSGTLESAPQSALPSALRRLTTEGQNVAPVWSRDGLRVIYASRRDGPFALVARTLDDAAAAAILVNGVARQPLPTSASPDGIVYVDAQPKTGLDLWFLPWSGGAARPLLQTPADETFGALSPDGRWLAYQSNASGTWAVMLRAREAAPDTTDAIRIAPSDGSALAWTPDGRHLLFTADTRLFAADIAAPTSTDGPNAPLKPATPARVLATDIHAASGFGVAPDGRILVRRRDPSSAPARLEVVLDWSRELSAKVPIRPRTPRPVR